MTTIPPQTPAIPTRIIREPFRRQLGNGKSTVIYPCDDGREYQIMALAEVTGINRVTIYKRIKKYGWNYDHILRLPGEAAPIPDAVSGRPSCLTGEPYQKRLADGTLKRFYPCDNGKEYLLGELAEIVGVDRNTIYSRIKRFGWNSAVVLLPPVRDGLTLNGFARNSADAEGGGNAEWLALGSCSRKKRLATLRQPTAYDRMFAGMTAEEMRP
jgi:transposase-like protein